MDSPPPQPNRDERPKTPAASTDRERDGRSGESDAAPSDASGLRPPPASPRRLRGPTARDAGRLLARSAGAGVVGALIGVALAVLLPSRPPEPAGSDALPAAEAVPPAPATRDESLARQRTFDGSAATDTRPDDHTLARRDADRPPARATDSPAAVTPTRDADGAVSSDPLSGDRRYDRDGAGVQASSAPSAAEQAPPSR